MGGDLKSTGVHKLSTSLMSTHYRCNTMMLIPYSGGLYNRCSLLNHYISPFLSLKLPGNYNFSSLHSAFCQFPSAGILGLSMSFFSFPTLAPDTFALSTLPQYPSPNFHSLLLALLFSSRSYFQFPGLIRSFAGSLSFL